MIEFIIEVGASTVLKKVKRKNRLFLDGNRRAIRKNPHAIVVGSGPSTAVNYWYITLMEIYTIAEYAI